MSNSDPARTPRRGWVSVVLLELLLGAGVVHVDSGGLRFEVDPVLPTALADVVDEDISGVLAGVQHISDDSLDSVVRLGCTRVAGHLEVGAGLSALAPVLFVGVDYTHGICSSGFLTP